MYQDYRDSNAVSKHNGQKVRIKVWKALWYPTRRGSYFPCTVKGEKYEKFEAFEGRRKNRRHQSRAQDFEGL